jgi:hypothetical protein
MSRHDKPRHFPLSAGPTTGLIQEPKAAKETIETTEMKHVSPATAGI